MFSDAAGISILVLILYRTLSDDDRRIDVIGDDNTALVDV